MKAHVLRLCLSGGVLMLAACGDTTDKAAPEQKASVAPVTDADPAPPPAAAPAPRAVGDATLDYAADPAVAPPTAIEAGIGSGDKAIPAAIQGRWALKAEDCARRPGTDLTALVIDAKTLHFFESAGDLARVRDHGANRIVADYKFSGEGQEWDRLMLLGLADGGKTLVRRDYGDGAAADAMRYTRCAA